MPGIHYLLILFKMHDYGETIRQAELILKEHPQFIPALLYRGLAHQALGRLEKAQGDFQAAADQADITPEDHRFALNMLVDLALQQKNYALALNRLEDLEKLEEDFNLFYRRGLALEGSGRLADAEKAYRRALERAKDTPERVRVYPGPGRVGSQAPGLARRLPGLPCGPGTGAGQPGGVADPGGIGLRPERLWRQC